MKWVTFNILKDFKIIILNEIGFDYNIDHTYLYIYNIIYI